LPCTGPFTSLQPVQPEVRPAREKTRGGHAFWGPRQQQLGGADAQDFSTSPCQPPAQTRLLPCNQPLQASPDRPYCGCLHSQTLMEHMQAPRLPTDLTASSNPAGGFCSCSRMATCRVLRRCLRRTQVQHRTCSQTLTKVLRAGQWQYTWQCSAELTAGCTAGSPGGLCNEQCATKNSNG